MQGLAALHSGTPIIYKFPPEETYFDHLVKAYEIFSSPKQLSDYNMDQLHYHLKKIQEIANKSLRDYLVCNIGFQRLNLLGETLDIPWKEATPGTFVKLQFFQSLIQGKPAPEDMKQFFDEILVPRQLSGSLKTQRMANDPYFPQWFSEFQRLILNAEQIAELKTAMGTEIPSAVWNQAFEERIRIQNLIATCAKTDFHDQDYYYLSMCLRKRYLKEDNETTITGDKKIVENILEDLVRLIESTGDYKVPYASSVIFWLEQSARKRGLTYKIVYPQ